MRNNPKRELILRSGSECFARYGYDKTTLDDIGRRAGLNKASLYYYFKNKEDIFIAVVLADTQTFIADLKVKSQAFPDVRKQIRFYLSERIRRYGEVLHLTQRSIENWQPLEAMFDEVYRETKVLELLFLVEMLKIGVANNAFNFTEPTASVAESLFHLSDALKHEVAYTTQHLRPEAAYYSLDRFFHAFKLFVLASVPVL